MSAAPRLEIALTLHRHPASVEAMVALTPDIVATGSEDGMIRVMQVHPNKFRKSRACAINIS